MIIWRVYSHGKIFQKERLRTVIKVIEIELEKKIEFQRNYPQFLKPTNNRQKQLKIGSKKYLNITLKAKIKYCEPLTRQTLRKLDKNSRKQICRVYLCHQRTLQRTSAVLWTSRNVWACKLVFKGEIHFV